jgi:tRNA pseudouridine55 synthase
MNGAIIVDKPRSWTSHDVVNKMRRIAGTRKIGHLGTLDPLATGVLPLLLNRATRLAQFFGKNDKQYEGVVQFGWATDTYDAEGTPSSPAREVVLTAADIEAAFGRFTGTLEQKPPPVSAKKVAGRPAYALARKQIDVDLPPVTVTVYRLDIAGMEGPDVRIRVHCSSGTYVRSIAHDAGQALGCGAFLKSLRRLASGPFELAQARTLDEIGKLASENRLEEALIPAARLLPEFPTEVVDAISEGQIRQGRDFRASPFRSHSGSKYLKAVSHSGELVAIGEAVLPNLYHPVVVL